jgi:oxygen-independent coproporphyrinogen-3 oxidase
MQEKQYIVEMEGGGKIALYRLKNLNPIGLPLIIAHGMISNSEAVRDLGWYLTQLGFDCWLLEWGGHGQSTAFNKRQDFEYPAFNDLPTAISKIIQVTGQQRVYWVSHSGGCHLALMYLARNPERQEKFAGLVTIGAQATDAALGLKHKVRALMLWWVTNLFGQTPRALVSVGTEGEPTRLLAQWSKWNLRGKWMGEDGFDYMNGLAKIKIPALIFAGSNDDIAPVSGCKKVYEAIGSVDKTWLVCSISNHFSKDFTHGKLIRGEAAKNEIFPQVGEWLKKRNAILKDSR